MSTWTIQYNGVEQSAAAWGLNAAPKLRYRTQSPSQFTFKMAAADPAGNYPFPYKAQVIIRQNRAGAGTTWANDGSANHFVWQGRMTRPHGTVNGKDQYVVIEFADPWWDLEQLPYQQQWTIASGLAYFSRAYLFYSFIGSTPGYLTVARQLTNIIQFAQANGANIQPGTIQGTAEMPWYAVRKLSCADAVKKCLECWPDLICWIDGSTTPPSFNCVYRANLTALTLPYKGTDAFGRKHWSSQIDPRYDLQPSCVVLQYQTQVTSGSTSAVQLSTDAWPLGSTGLQLGALVCPIDLRGSTSTFANTTITAEAFDPTNVAGFWQKRVKSLADQDIQGVPALVDSVILDGVSATTVTNPFGIQVTDAQTGAYIAGPTTYNLVSGKSKIPAWTGFTAFKANITCNLNYTKARKIGTAATARTTDQARSHFHSVKVTLTNAPTGTHPYQTMLTYDSGEAAITGLAQALYTSYTQLQYDGEHVLWEQNRVYQIIGPWNVLNLSGGNAAWAAMNASIPEVSIDFFTNQTTIKIGPQKHLGPQEWSNLLHFFARRLIIDNAGITSGNATGPSVDMSGEGEFEDAAPGTPLEGYHEHREADTTTPANTNAITIDPANGQQQSNFFDSGGNLLGTALVVQDFNGGGAPGAGTLPAGINFNAGWRYRDTSVSPQQEYVCTAAGSNSTSTWAEMGGNAGAGSPPGFWNHLNSYLPGNVVQVTTTTTYGGITILPGTYAATLSIPANPTGNQIPQFPYPGGTIYWIFLSPMPQAVNACAAGGTTIYIPTTGGF